MNQWKSAHAAETKARTLAEALDGADAVFGLSVKGAFTDDMIRSMADKPIIFAMANPDPEITPEEVARIRDDVIIATGRSTIPTRSTTSWLSLHLPGALDVRATTINMEMKIAAAQLSPISPGRTCPTRWPRPTRARVRGSAATTSSRCLSIRASSRRSRPPSREPRAIPASPAGRWPTCAPTRRSFRPASTRGGNAQPDLRASARDSRSGSCSPRARRNR